MNYDLTSKELADHIYKEYGGVYDKFNLRSFVYFINMCYKMAMQYPENGAKIAFIRGAIDGMRHLAFHIINSEYIDDIKDLTWCYDDLSKGNLSQIFELVNKISKDKYIFPDELRSDKQRKP